MKTGQAFTIHDLTSAGDFNCGHGHIVRTYDASWRDPKLTGILYTHPDSQVHGRQWVTEISVQEVDSCAEFSLCLSTSDVSTRVREVPHCSRPRLIDFIAKNCEISPGTPGMNVINLDDSEDAILELKQVIELETRDYLLVLTSQSEGEEYALDLSKMQEQVLGLAQVVDVSRVNSWEMEKHLGRKLCAWGNAINLINPPRKGSDGQIRARSSLILSRERESWPDYNVNPYTEILSRVTHVTNGRRKKAHYSPIHVRLKRSADAREHLREQLELAQSEGDAVELFELAARELDEKEQEFAEAKSVLENRLSDLEEDNANLEIQVLEIEDKLGERDDAIRILRHDKRQLLSQLEEAGGATEAEDLGLADYLRRALIGTLVPGDALAIVGRLFPGRIIILDSAYESAEESAQFKSSARLLDMLIRLGTEYYEAMREGGDQLARQVFTNNEYASNESETVRSSALGNQRQFEYDGQTQEFYRHLKIGTDPDPRHTLRVYFYWDGESEKIVIGYCGPHLPVATHRK